MPVIAKYIYEHYHFFFHFRNDVIVGKENNDNGKVTTLPKLT